LFYFRGLLKKIGQAFLFDKAKIENFYVVRQCAGLVRRRVQPVTGEFRTRKAEINAALGCAGVCFACAADGRAVPFDCSATGTGQSFPFNASAVQKSSASFSVKGITFLAMIICHFR
jgi:hypothetical protein